MLDPDLGNCNFVVCSTFVPVHVSGLYRLLSGFTCQLCMMGVCVCVMPSYDAHISGAICCIVLDKMRTTPLMAINAFARAPGALSLAAVMSVLYVACHFQSS